MARLRINFIKICYLGDIQIERTFMSATRVPLIFWNTETIFVSNRSTFVSASSSLRTKWIDEKGRQPKNAVFWNKIFVSAMEWERHASLINRVLAEGIVFVSVNYRAKRHGPRCTGSKGLRAQTLCSSTVFVSATYRAKHHGPGVLEGKALCQPKHCVLVGNICVCYLPSQAPRPRWAVYWKGRRSTSPNPEFW